MPTPTPTLLRCFKSAKDADSTSITQDANGKGERRLTQQETWTVIYSGVVQQATVLTATGLPVVGLAYSGLVCTGVNPRRDANSPNVWRVTVDYQARVTPSGDSGTVFNLDIRKSSASREETATQDRLGLFLTNTFGELLPELPNITLYDDVYSITWTTTVAPNWGDIEGKTNSDSFSFTICGISRSFTKSQVKCVGANFSSNKIISATDGGTTTYAFTYNCEIVIQVRKPKWVWNAPNEGWRGYNDNDEVATFADPNDGSDGATPRTSPTKMSLDGHALDPGSEPLKLPDAAIGASVPSACRSYAADGAFELEQQTAFTSLFATLHD